MKHVDYVHITLSTDGALDGLPDGGLEGGQDLPDDGVTVEAPRSWLGGRVPGGGGGDLHRALLSLPALLVAVNTSSVTGIINLSFIRIFRENLNCHKTGIPFHT